MTGCPPGGCSHVTNDDVTQQRTCLLLSDASMISSKSRSTNVLFWIIAASQFFFPSAENIDQECELKCHHGVCRLDSVLGKYCLCDEFHTGELCSRSFIEHGCAFNCMNGGECWRDTSGAPECRCKPGFRGALCNIKLNCTLKCGTGQCFFHPQRATEQLCKCSKTFQNEPCTDIDAGKASVSAPGKVKQPGGKPEETPIKGLLQSKSTTRNPAKIMVTELSKNKTTNKMKPLVRRRRNSFQSKIVAFGKNIIEKTENAVGCLGRPCAEKATCKKTDDGMACVCKDGHTGPSCYKDKKKKKKKHHKREIMEMHHHHRAVRDQRRDTTKHHKRDNRHTNSNKKEGLDCRSAPCLNGGICPVGRTAERLECLCPPGLTGKQCEVNINDCLNNSCLNGGRCIDRLNGYICVCIAPYTGQKCELIKNTERSSEPVLELTDGVNDASKALKEAANLMCHPNPCTNSGTCLVSNNHASRPMCLCKENFTGALCETMCHGELCSGIGTKPPTSANRSDSLLKMTETSKELVNQDASKTKRAAENATVTGPLAGQQKGTLDCIKTPCLNGGMCFNVNGTTGQKKCACPPGTSGERCETLLNGTALNATTSKPPTSPPTTTPTTKVTTTTSTTATTTNQSKGANLCDSDPCVAGATCLITSKGFKCICADGNSGNRCLKNPPDPCEIQPCGSVAKCKPTKERSQGFKCVCGPGFIGDRCERSFDVCIDAPCVAGMFCKRDNSSVKGYQCVSRTMARKNFFGPTAVIVGLGTMVSFLILVAVIVMCIYKKIRAPVPKPDQTLAAGQDPYDALDNNANQSARSLGFPENKREFEITSDTESESGKVEDDEHELFSREYHRLQKKFYHD